MNCARNKSESIRYIEALQLMQYAKKYTLSSTYEQMPLVSDVKNHIRNTTAYK